MPKLAGGRFITSPKVYADYKSVSKATISPAADVLPSLSTSPQSLASRSAVDSSKAELNLCTSKDNVFNSSSDISVFIDIPVTKSI